MKVVVQRVKNASVKVSGKVISEIDSGLLVFLGIRDGDNEKGADYLSEKIAHLRIFDDVQGKMNLSALNVKAHILVVSQFTLYGDCRKGRRPSYSKAMVPEAAEKLYRVFIKFLESYGLIVRTGVFQEKMQVSMINDGPVTLIIDSVAIIG